MPEPLKNMYNEAYIATLSLAIETIKANFDSEGFAHRIFDTDWINRELKDRMRHITGCLHHFLPDDYESALSILRQVAEDKSLQGYTFENMIFPDFVEVYGLERWEKSLPALEQFTQLSSAEFAVRPFIVQDSKRMMTQMLEWASHENHHVRRLASEGCRPRLPWAMALPEFKKDPSAILPILKLLKNDRSDYVTRSLANNLNDISKDNPKVVLDTLSEWQKQPTDTIRWITGHALRTLVKAGDEQALALLGYGDAEVSIDAVTITPDSISMGKELEFSFTLSSEKDESQALMIDYVMHFVRANGKTSPKVFKLKKMKLAPGETVTISKKHSFKPISTRRYYPGTHTIAIQVNGIIIAENHFELE